MTNFEQRQLADIERRLIAESPDLDRILTGAGGRQSGVRRRRGWWWAGGVTVLISVALIWVGVGLGLVAVAVAAVCPPVTYLLLLGVSIYNQRAKER